MARPLDRFALYPFLLAVFPVLSLLAANPARLDPSDALRPLVLSLALTGVVWGAARLLMRTWDRAAALTALLVVLFFLYGHAYAFFRTIPALDDVLGRHRYLVLANAVVLVGAALVLRKRPPSPSFTRFLNIFALVAVGLSLAQVAWTVARSWPQRAAPERPDPAAIPLATPGEMPRPDIDYIVLDAYTRQDVLRDTFGYDNRPFLDALEAMGFVVADDSRSNYAVTRLSLPSSLNLDYLEAIGPPLDPAATDAVWLDAAARYSIVRRSLEAAGYTTVAFESAYGMTDWTDADVYLSRRPLALSQARALGQVTPFEVLLIQTSAGRLLLDAPTWLNAALGTDLKTPHEQHRERILFVLDGLARMPEVPGPKFVFAHLMTPHPPYVFTADGGVAPDPAFFSLAVEQGQPAGLDPIEGYTSQVAFLNSRLLPVLRAILEQSPGEPIIVIQGDHGAVGVPPADRLKILNAYYLPPPVRGRAYDAISPVNTFRLIFTYLGADLPLLPDRSFYSSLERPFRLTPMP